MRPFALAALIATTTVAVDPIPGESTVTDIVWTDNVKSVAATELTMLTASSSPPIPEDLGVSGTITAGTDADGDSYITVDLSGKWGAKFQNSNAYGKLYASMGFIFVLETFEESFVDGVETTTPVTNKELLTYGGLRNKNE